ncbi:hypothetical protein [Pseudonocardia lacus]|uniref:hypothetical protein n=1 Tax=Pseudonocardia lacus TaxID=2835865 RepID=UPI001BDC0522|nr:hypothetical protein [Pseudonocardia lacus]
MTSSIDEVKSGIMQACSQISESNGALQQANSALQQAQGTLQRVTQGTSQADVSEAIALLNRAMDGVQEVQQAADAAVQAAEGVAARL